MCSVLYHIIKIVYNLNRLIVFRVACPYIRVSHQHYYLFFPFQYCPPTYLFCMYQDYRQLLLWPISFICDGIDFSWRPIPHSQHKNGKSKQDIYNADCRGLFQLEKSSSPIDRKWLYVINLNFFVWRQEGMSLILA